ncbi:MAG: hypothetical protein PHF72_08460 [Gammaproteobacteria bacterium]|nr:hypothetical protein [Gammaproteobacteria bacterium]
MEAAQVQEFTATAVPVVGLVLSLLYVSRQYLELRWRRFAVERSQLELLIGFLRDSGNREMTGVERLLLEQVFRNYFGYLLGASEIQYVLSMEFPSRLIARMKYAGGILKYQDGIGFYYPKRKMSLRVKDVALSVLQSIFLIAVLSTVGHGLETNDSRYFFVALLGVLIFVVVLNSSMPVVSARSILLDHGTGEGCLTPPREGADCDS